MSNHLHLAIQVGNVSLSRILQNLSFRFTQWVNWRQNKRGHLFQGRYKAVLVDADTYLKELTCYIHLNPIRAGILEDPEAYHWSSHRAYLGLEVIPWLTTDWVLSLFSGRLGVARRAYEKFVWEEKGAGHQEHYHRGSSTDSRILGDESFIDRVLGKKEAAPKPKVKLEQVIKEVCRHYSLKEGDLGAGGKDRRLSEARGMAAWLIMELRVCPLRELGKVTCRDITTLSSAMKRLQMRASTNLRLAKAMRALSKTIF